MPVDPGNLMLIGQVNGAPVLGAPGCARSPKENGFDWILMRLLAGLPVTRADITGLGVGGLLMEIVTRPQPRAEPPAASRRRIAGVVLAAGRSTRMGGPNKLLAEIARRTLERFGRIDILVNNAALPVSTRFPDLTAEEWRRVIEVNLTAPFLMTKTVLPAMRAQHYGRIINISSSAGRMVSTLGGAHYTASKAGLLGLTRAAAKELGKFGITVNAICPGMIDTELTREHASDKLLERLAASYPVPRLGTAVEVADLICFAASEAAGYITGASLDINGGDLMM